MKKISSLLCILFLVFSACSEDNDVFLKKVNVTVKFTHNWDGVPVNSSDFNDFKFTNENGESISIERLRYLVSNINLGKNVYENATSTAYNLIDVGENAGLEIQFSDINEGIHQVNFTFGLSNENNKDGIYSDLNSANFNVPTILGGGYHYMQFDGKFKDEINQDVNFNYDVIKAVDSTDPDNLVFTDTSFSVYLDAVTITGDTTIEIKMDISEWFKNPNSWILNDLNSDLTSNFEAQKLMSANGKTVFSLGEITP